MYSEDMPQSSTRLPIFVKAAETFKLDRLYPKLYK